MKRPILTALTFAALLLVSTAAVAGLAPGDEAPSFTLTDTEGNEHILQDYLDDKQIVVLEWFNPDCPFIKKHHLNHKTMDETYAAVREELPVVWLAINSSANGKQGYGLERNQEAVKEYEMTFPVLLDASGEVGHAYGAKTTPHMFIVTPDGKIAYVGAIDSDKSADTLGKTNYVLDFLNAMAAGKELPTAETKPYGCSVKYAK